MSDAPAAVEAAGRTIEISNPDKVLFPASGTTKLDLARYYARIADHLLPHVEGRAVSMQRFPDGVADPGFYQKQTPEYFPDWIRTKELRKESGTVRHVVIDSAATLVYLAGQACVTPHVWLSRIDRPDHPDRMIFDLDPSRKDFTDVRACARALRDVLDDLSLPAFVMTSGSRGLHVTVPLDRRAGFDAVRAFARRVAGVVASAEPDRFTTEQRKDGRAGRVFIDTLRNGWAQTSAPPYSVRARPTAPVATPLDWSELGRSGMGPRKYTVNNLFRRLARVDDPWRNIDRYGGGIEAAAKRLDSMRQTD